MLSREMSLILYIMLIILFLMINYIIGFQSFSPKRNPNKGQSSTRDCLKLLLKTIFIIIKNCGIGEKCFKKPV